MGTKQTPGAYDCYANALPDEPMFTLLARDPYAPLLICYWADKREKDIRNGLRPASDAAMVEEARACAHAMMIWRAENEGKWREKSK